MFSENTLRPTIRKPSATIFGNCSISGERPHRINTASWNCSISWAFRQTEETFHLIENNTHTVYVSLPESERLIARLLEGERSKGLMRKLSLYSLSIYDQHYQELYRAGDIRPIDGENGVLVNSSLYAMHTGLSLKADSGRAEFILIRLPPYQSDMHGDSHIIAIPRYNKRCELAGPSRIFFPISFRAYPDSPVR